MDSGSKQPLLKLIERSGDEASRIVVSPPRTSRLRRAFSAIAACGLALARRLGKIVWMSSAAESDDLLSYMPKRDKIVEGVLFLLEQAQEADAAMTADTMTTVMFLADKGHLDAYGRPVFFDNYVATREGPVGVTATEMLDPKFDWSTIDIDAAPWTRDAADDAGRLRATQAPNLRRLSRSDVSALTSALSTVTSLNGEQLRLFTKRHTAYATAWRDGSGAGARLDPRLIPEVRDDQMIDDLLYASRHAFVAPRRT